MTGPDSPGYPAPSLGNFLRGWDQFWFRPADPTTLCFLRICGGLLTFYVVLSYSWGLFDLVGPRGLFDRETADYVRHEQVYYDPGFDWETLYKVHSKGNYFWSVFYHVESPAWIVALHAAFLGALALFTLGLWTRVTSALAWVAAMSYTQRASITVFGMDTMMMILLFYLMIGPSGATLSVDRWLEKRRARRAGLPEPPVRPSVLANLAVRLVQVHLCVIYLAGGTSKLLGASWWNGTALNQVMLNYSFAPMDARPYRTVITWLARYRPLWEVLATAGAVYTLVLEIGFPFLVWDRRLRWVFLCGAVGLHTGIGLFMGLTAFSLFMLVLVSSFVPPEVIRQVLARLGRQAADLGRRRPAAGLSREPAALVLTRR